MPASQRRRAAHAKGKMPARERIEYLLDRDLPGARHAGPAPGPRHAQDDRPYTDGVITGWGTIDGRQVFVFSQDFTVFGGALGEVFAEKIHKVMDLAIKVGVPVIGLNDGAGARIQEGVVRCLLRRHLLPQRGASGVIPQISVILGPCAGGAVYTPAMTDFIFMVQGTTHMFITGPDVVKTVTGEEVTLEELGGARAMPRSRAWPPSCRPTTRPASTTSLPAGVPAGEQPGGAPFRATDDEPDAPLPELVDLLPASPNQPYDMRAVIGTVVDDGEFFE